MQNIIQHDYKEYSHLAITRCSLAVDQQTNLDEALLRQIFPKLLIRRDNNDKKQKYEEWNYLATQVLLVAYSINALNGALEVNYIVQSNNKNFPSTVNKLTCVFYINGAP